MKRTFLTPLLAAALLLPAGSFADDTATSNLHEVVVTATRNAKSPDEVTADVEIVSREEIKTAPANNVDDILRRLPGVDIRRPSDFGITSPMAINIRGVGSGKRVLLMVDGVPTNSALTGFIYPNQIQTGAIERVEVVKGAFSSLYGSNAMGGVINVITKEKQTEGLEVTPRVKAGNFGLREAGVEASGRKGKLAYTLNTSHRQVDNLYQRDQQVSYSYNNTTDTFDRKFTDISDHSAYDDQRFFSKFSYDLSDETRLSFSGNLALTESENGYTHYQPTQREKETERTFYFLNANASTLLADRVDLDFRVYTNYDKSDAISELISKKAGSSGGGGGMGGMGGGASSYSFDYGTREYWGRDTGIQIKAGMAAGDNHYLTAGVDSNFLSGEWENKKEDGTLVGTKMDESISNQAIYLQSESDLFEAFTLTLGMRYDANSESDNAFSPKVGLLYRATDTISFRTSAGKAFRAPNLNELYTPTWMMMPGVPFESNPNLKPETIWSYDLGVDLRLAKQFNLSLTGFYSKAEDLISSPMNHGVMRYENLDEVTTDGFEVSADGQLMPWLGYYANYTYTHSVDKESGRLTDRPLHQANAGLMATRVLSPKARLTTSLDLRYNSEMTYMAYKNMMSKAAITVDDWVVADLGVRLELFDKLGIQAAVTNLTNEDYEVHGANLGPERAWWVAVDYTF